MILNEIYVWYKLINFRCTIYFIMKITNVNCCIFRLTEILQYTIKSFSSINHVIESAVSRYVKRAKKNRLLNQMVKRFLSDDKNCDKKYVAYILCIYFLTSLSSKMIYWNIGTYQMPFNFNFTKNINIFSYYVIPNSNLLRYKPRISF